MCLYAIAYHKHVAVNNNKYLKIFYRYNVPDNTTKRWRAGLQPQLPEKLTNKKPAAYDIFPSHSVGTGKIFNGYASLAKWIATQKFVAIDGYVGVFWNEVKQSLADEFEKLNLSVNWLETADHLKSPAETQKLVGPYTGEPGAVWGTKTDLTLADFYTVKQLVADAGSDITIVIGTAASLFAENAHLVYLDLPKNELQLRMRAGVVTNLGNNVRDTNAEMYKRFYFVDWEVLNQHKKTIVDKIEILADAQWKDSINWMEGDVFRNALNDLGKTVFRVRPWFEAGAWGGHWMKERLEGLNKDEVNLAWSFELIVPENGLVFESDGNLLEASFDFLMFKEKDAVLGKHTEKFGYDFPIRFDFLDTWDGGNLSIQCHPSQPYIEKYFGERVITQDETYYILDCQDDATVYLGFQDDIDPTEFRGVLENSQATGEKIEITKYVQEHQAKKHALFLIPNGTVHSAGAGNLVLEISATPYIFTFKMYDWVRLDLNGEPRAINIEHAFNNLKFDRKGEKVVEELISKQTSIKQGGDWEIVHVPTHKDHFYDVERLEFDSTITVQTEGSVHVLMLVEGTSITVTPANGTATTFYYAETFVIPAAAGSYTLVNNGTARAKVVTAFIKA
jgi:mannose-6-phosphate isomerase class I